MFNKKKKQIEGLKKQLDELRKQLSDMTMQAMGWEEKSQIYKRGLAE